jgi:hypothetical protein
VGHVENRVVEYQRSKYSLRFILFLNTTFKTLPSKASVTVRADCQGTMYEVVTVYH